MLSLHDVKKTLVVTKGWFYKNETFNKSEMNSNNMIKTCYADP